MVEMDAIRFGYKRRSIFEGLNLVLEPGNIYGLLGLNGAGKSTLLRLLSGLLFPDSGRVRVLGHEPRRRSPALLSRIYMLPEAFQLPDIRDRQYISRFAPFYPRFDLNYMERLLAELEVPRDAKLSGLSLGEQKKFHLAFGLACGASLLILDEPSNGLDIPSKRAFRKLVAEALTAQRAIVIATHQVKDVELLIDKVVILHNGTFICHVDLSEISARLRFTRESTRPDPHAAGLLHVEPALGGHAAVWADASSGNGHPDLELFFNAVVANPDDFTRYFHKD